MTTFYIANVTATNGSAFVDINSSSQDVDIVRERSLLQIGTNQIVEVKRALPGTPDQLELASPWSYSTTTADAIAAPTAGDLADAVAQIRTLSTQAETILNNAVAEGDLATRLKTAAANVLLGRGDVGPGDVQELDAAAVRALLNVYYPGNILGTVSESGGVPTGALFQRITGANGTALRLPDGMQICLHQQASSSGGAVGWTYPAAFAAGSAGEIYADCQAIDASARVGSISPLGENALSFSVWLTNNTRISETCMLIAIGRWY